MAVFRSLCLHDMAFVDEFTHQREQQAISGRGQDVARCWRQREFLSSGRSVRSCPRKSERGDQRQADPLRAGRRSPRVVELEAALQTWARCCPRMSCRSRSCPQGPNRVRRQRNQKHLEHDELPSGATRRIDQEVRPLAPTAPSGPLGPHGRPAEGKGDRPREGSGPVTAGPGTGFRRLACTDPGAP